MKAKDAVKLLNKLLDEQGDFTSKVIDSRFHLTDSFLESSLPFVCSRKNDGLLSMGIIGIINGIVSDGRVAACYDENKKLTGFVVVNFD